MWNTCNINLNSIPREQKRSSHSLKKAKDVPSHKLRVATPQQLPVL